MCPRLSCLFLAPPSSLFVTTSIIACGKHLGLHVYLTTVVFSSSPESLLGVDRSSDSKSPSPHISPSVFYKLVVPILK